MSLDHTIFATLIIGGVVLFATKPTAAEIENKVIDLIHADIQQSQATDFAEGIMLFTCKYNSKECAQLIRATIDVQIEDKFLVKLVSLQFDSNSTNCLGVLNQLYCPAFMNEQ